MRPFAIALDLVVGIVAAALAYLAYHATGQIVWTVAILVAATTLFALVHWRRMQDSGDEGGP